MSPKSFAIVSLLAGLLAQQVVAVDKTRDPQLDAQLVEAATQLDRLALLPSNDDWTFDFTKQDYYTFSPGGVINMNAATFPAAKGNGQTLAMLNLGPCAMLPPHYHPRASNYVVAIKGSTTTYMYEENGARLVTANLTPGKATIFPMGAMHTMQNTGCDDAQLVSALNSDDAGTQNIMNVFTNGFPFGMVNAALGQNVASDGTASKVVPVGTGSVLGDPACLARCGMAANTTTTHSRTFMA